MSGVGTLATGTTASVDEHGAVQRGAVRLGWRVRSGNAWLVPGRDAVARRSRPGPAPIVHTALRIPGGDAVERVYAVDDGGTDAVVVEVENASPETIAVAFDVEAPGIVTVGESGARVDDAPVVVFARRPGAVESGPTAVFPVPHRTTVRVALTARAEIDVRALPDAAAVARAWASLLDRGLRTELPEPLQSEVDAARADVLLAPPSPAAFATLEAWGLDREALAMWGHLSMRDRRAARRAPGSGLLGTTRAALVHERDRVVEILPGFRAAWLGEQLAVHDAPLRRGSCSFALRWHAAHPALLWDVPPGTTARAPALDPGWSSDRPAGEVLLAAPPTSLLAMGERAPVTGTAVDAPEQFS